jgi:hypothetical protein
MPIEESVQSPLEDRLLDFPINICNVDSLVWLVHFLNMIDDPMSLGSFFGIDRCVVSSG